MGTHATLWRLGALAGALGLLYATLSSPAPPAPPVPPHQPNYFAFVPSMAGTVPDGDINLTGERLVVDPELGHLFDYYLAGLGERDLPAIRAEIERALASRLTPATAAQAKLLLAAYLAYKQALANAEPALPKGATLVQSVRNRLELMRALRRRHFSDEESAGLFGPGEAADLHAIARMEVEQDGALDGAQKRDKLAALDAALPPAARAERAAPLAVASLEQSVASARARGASEEEVYRLRATAFSPAAADRLARLDRDETAWKARIATYLAQRGALAAGAAGADAQAVQRLRDSAFNAQEQRRLAAYE
ncbi:MAG: lipase secretion chaperone [Pseudomonadota bacterium]